MRKIRKSMVILLATIIVSTITVSTVTTIMLVRAQNPDFGLFTFPSFLNLQPGTCATKTIVIGSINGFSGVVTLTSTTSPASPGVTETITPSSVVVPPNGNATATKTICASATAPAECQTETITGASATIVHSVSEQDCVVIPPPPPMFTYTAKWICNVRIPGNPFNGNAAENIGLVPGEYKTDINVHNPSLSQQSLALKKKIVLSVPEAPFVNVTRVAFLSTVVAPDGAFFMECKEIMAALGLPINTPAKGFIVIIATTQFLNVVAEYSSEIFGPTSNIGQGISLEVVNVPAGPFIP